MGSTTSKISPEASNVEPGEIINYTFAIENPPYNEYIVSGTIYDPYLSFVTKNPAISITSDEKQFVSTLPGSVSFSSDKLNIKVAVSKFAPSKKYKIDFKVGTAHTASTAYIHVIQKDVVIESNDNHIKLTNNTKKIAYIFIENSHGKYHIQLYAKQSKILNQTDSDIIYCALKKCESCECAETRIYGSLGTDFDYTI